MASAWTLRAGCEEDIQALYELDLMCFDEPFRFDERAMRRFVLYRGAIVIVAEAEGVLAGFVIVHVIRRSRQKLGYLVTLDVAPEFRRRGLARELVHLAEARALSAGAEGTALHVSAENEDAIRFYERAGYARLERCADFYGAGRDGWIYSKGLANR